MNARVEASDDLLELEIAEIWKRLLYRDDHPEAYDIILGSRRDLTTLMAPSREGP